MTELNAKAGQGSQPAGGRPLKFLFAPMSYMLSHVCRCVEIGKVLRDQGHEVVFAVEDPAHPRWRSYVAQQNGFRCVRTPEQDYGYIWDKFENHGFLAVGLALMRLQQWSPLDEIIEGYVRVIQQEKPDIIVGDGSVGASNAAYIAGIPAAGVMNAYAGKFGSRGSIYLPLISTWDALMLEPIRRRVYRKHQVKPINSIRLVKSIPMISPDVENLYSYPPDFQWRMVGPIVSEPPSTMPEWFDELSDGKTNIYLSLGTTGMLDPLLRRVYEPFSKSPYRFVVTTGGQATEETVAMAPANFRIAKYAPGRALLKHCQATIFHGGNGTMYQVLEAGIPMIALPAQLEQRLTGEMIVKQGLGLSLSPRTVTAAQLLDALEKVLRDPSYRDRIKPFSEAVKASTGAAQAAAILTSVAREGKPAGRGL